MENGKWKLEKSKEESVIVELKLQPSHEKQRTPDAKAACGAPDTRRAGWEFLDGWIVP